MEVAPGKLGQRGINLQAEKTPNLGNPQKTNTKEGRGIMATTIFCKKKNDKVAIYYHRYLWIFFLKKLLLKMCEASMTVSGTVSEELIKLAFFL